MGNTLPVDFTHWFSSKMAILAAIANYLSQRDCLKLPGNRCIPILVVYEFLSACFTGGLTVSTHLGLSVEHSHQSLATINGVGLHDGSVPVGTVEGTMRKHCYVNTSINSILNGNLQSSSSHNERQDRLCASAGVTQTDHTPRPPRRHSTATCTDRPKVKKRNQYTIVESSDKSESDLEASASSVSTCDKSLHYYSVPEGPFFFSPNYDRLEELPEPAQTDAIHRYDRLSVPPEIEAGCHRSKVGEPQVDDNRVAPSVHTNSSATWFLP